MSADRTNPCGVEGGVGRWRPGPTRCGSRPACPTPSTRCHSAHARRWRRCPPGRCRPARWDRRGPRPESGGRRGSSGGPPRPGRSATADRRGRRRASWWPGAGGRARSSGSCRPGCRRPEAPPPPPGCGPPPAHPPRYRTTGAATTGAAPRRVAVETVPVGSKRRHRPDRRRAAAVASSTSGLVDVETTAPGADNTLGMINDDVFPDRGGPSTSTARCGGAKHQPRSSWPR